MSEGELRERLRLAEEENADLRDHLRTMVSGAAIVTRCWREGEIPEDIFYEALEEATAKAGAELLADANGSAAPPEEDGPSPAGR